MMKKKIDIKKNKYGLSLAAFWAICFVILVVCYGLFQRPQKEILLQTQRQYTESQDFVAVARKAVKQDVQDQLQRRIEEADQTVQQFSVAQDNTNGLIFEIGKIANELGVLEFSSKDMPVKQFTAASNAKSGKEETGDITEAWLRVEFKASFLQFAQFINRLERQTPTVFVEKMTLIRNDEDPLRNGVRMEISFLVREDRNNSVAFADSKAD